MKTIKFSEKELGFIRQQYQVELEEAEEYVENLKTILNKIGATEIFKPAEEVVKGPARRGRKPKIQREMAAPATEPVEKKRKPRSDKGKKRAKRGSKAIQEKPMNESTSAPSLLDESNKPGDTEKKVLPKKMVKKHTKRRRGVFLTPLRKPL